MSAPASTERRRALPAILGVVMVVCCVAGPAVIGAVSGAVIGGWLGIAVAVVVALAVAGTLYWRSRNRGKAC